METPLKFSKNLQQCVILLMVQAAGPSHTLQGACIRLELSTAVGTWFTQRSAVFSAPCTSGVCCSNWFGSPGLALERLAGQFATGLLKNTKHSLLPKYRASCSFSCVFVKNLKEHLVTGQWRLLKSHLLSIFPFNYHLPLKANKQTFYFKGDFVFLFLCFCKRLSWVERIYKKICNTLNVSLQPLEYKRTDSFAGFWCKVLLYYSENRLYYLIL